MKKRKTKYIICIFSAVIMLALTIMLVTLTLIKTGDRQSSYRLTESLSTQVSIETRDMDIEQIIDYSLSFTARELRFAVLNDIPEGKANCVGYAQLCAAICNQAMVTNRISGQAKPVVGYLESNGINWCKVLRTIAPKDSYKNFVKNHDFVELNTPFKTYYFDPSIYDVLGNKCFTQTNKNADNNG